MSHRAGPSAVVSGSRVDGCVLGLLVLAGCTGPAVEAPTAVVSALTRAADRGRGARLAAGEAHSLVLTSSGKLLSWGKNSDGQLGRDPAAPDGSAGSGGLSELVAIAAGGATSYAQQVDGRLYAMGANASGQLGDSRTKPWDSSFNPADVALPTGAQLKAVASGSRFALALLADGTVYAWGRGQEGQLGDSSSADRNVPEPVLQLDRALLLPRAIVIAAGGDHALAIAEDGTLWAWGSNKSGQVDGRLIDPATHLRREKVTGAVQVSTDCDGNPIAEIVAIAAGDEHSLALSARGLLWAFGNNKSGQCGVGGAPPPAEVACPQRVVLPSGGGPVQLAAGAAFSVVLLSDGKFLSFGNNAQGQLGFGLGGNVTTPRSTALPGVILTELAAGARHVIATDARGLVYGWGDNHDHQLSTSKNLTLSPTALDDRIVTAGRSVSQLFASGNHSLLLTYDRIVYGAGENSASQLGNGETTPPAQWTTAIVHNAMGATSSLGNVTTVATGARHGLAIVGSGDVLPWGDNTYGQLGLAPPALPAPPVASLDAPRLSAPVSFATSGRVVGIAAGSGHSLALLADGRLYAFGLNSSGQLGLGSGSTANAATPQLVRSTRDANLYQRVIQAAAGEEFSLALLGDGSVYSWGLDTDGQLGQGARTPASRFTDQPGAVREPTGKGPLSGIAAIAGCATHALALSASGAVYAWGSNVYGQLAQDPLKLTGSSLPVLVEFPTATPMRAIACGSEHSLAISSTGELWSWGLNAHHQLGRAGASHQPQRVQTVTGVALQQVVGVAAGATHTLALTASGLLLAFGENTQGAFGESGITGSVVARAITTSP